jgi:hypothetical protein
MMPKGVHNKGLAEKIQRVKVWLETKPNCQFSRLVILTGKKSIVLLEMWG